MSKVNGLGSGGLHETRYYVLQWECGHCGTPDASFVDGVCVNCSNAFDEQEINKISSSDIRQTTDPKVIHEIMNVIGWFCSSCSNYNRNLERQAYEQRKASNDFSDLDCSCEGCGNELNPKEDGDYIMLDGPSANTPEGAVKALIRRNIKMKQKIYAKKVGRVLDSGSSSQGISPRLQAIGKSHRVSAMNALEKKHPNFYMGFGAGSVLLAAFLAYKGFEKTDTIIEIDGYSWSRTIALNSVQRLEKSDWAEDVEGSIYQTEAFYKFLETNSRYKLTGRESNHNPDYCYTTPESEQYTVYNTVCVPTTSQSCTATSGGGVSCTTVPSTSCSQVPEQKTRYYDAEHCEYLDFEINDYAFERNLTTSGNESENPEPYWQDYTLVDNAGDIGTQVEAGRTEQYTITVSYGEKNKTQSLVIPEALWRTLDIGMECNTKASFILGVDIDSTDWESCR